MAKLKSALLTGLSLITLSAMPAEAADKAGVSAGVRGEVLRTASAAGQPTNVAFKGGDAVFMGDGIESKPDAGMQVMLLDQTTFTIGPDSRLTIDEFVYDPAAGTGKVGASILKGGFRFVSGKVAANKPSDMVVKTPSATIGIRGTAVLGSVGPTETIIALAGPGRNNDTGDKMAGADIFTPNGNAELRRPGFAARIVGSLPPEIIRLTPELLARLESVLTPGSVGGGATPPRPAGQGGGGTAAAGGPPSASAPPTSLRSMGDSALVQTLVSVSNLHNVGGLTASSTTDAATTAGGFFSASDAGSQDAGTAVTAASAVAQGSGEFAFEDYTTVAQLVAAPAGVGSFVQNGNQIFDSLGGTGSYDFNLSVNFGSMNYTANYSNITNANTGVSGATVTMTQTSTPYFDPLALAQQVGGCGTGATCTTGFLLRNNGPADIARFADHYIVIENGSVTAVGSGTATRP